MILVLLTGKLLMVQVRERVKAYLKGFKFFRRRWKLSVTEGAEPCKFIKKVTPLPMSAMS